MITVQAYIENTYPQRKDIDFLSISSRSIPWINWFDRWLEALHPDLSPINNYELSLRLTNDTEIQQFNAQYRQKDRPTDVLAFAALETEILQPEDLSEPLYLGDIIISLDTAYRQAQEQQHSLNRELAWLASHGLLHLLGWDHPDDETREKMLAKQADLLKIIEITD